MPSSKKTKSGSKTVPEVRTVMPVDLFNAAIKGYNDVLIQRLGLQPDEQTEIQVTIEGSHSAPEQKKTEYQTVQSELQSVTHFGDTLLHLLITKRYNKLALKVFQRNMSLLKVQNKKLETPLHCAAKVGNEELFQNLIRINPAVVKDALEETNKKGDTTLHVAAKHGQKDVGHELMKFDPELAYKVNNESLSPLEIAISKGYTEMVQTILEVNPNLAYTQFSNGKFPVHEPACLGNTELVLHFMEKYPDDAELLDPRGRNLFHIAAKENQKKFFHDVFKNTSVSVREMIARMNSVKDNEGNTPLHIAAKEGRRKIMRTICENKMNHVAESIRNNQGLTPLELSARQLIKTTKNIDGLIRWYIENKGYKFTAMWFDSVMEASFKHKWEKTEVIGLGSVLITTVTFAAAFTIPGGYNQNDGTPILGRRYIFRAFVLANALAFIQGFLSLFALLTRALKGLPGRALLFATYTFVLAASSMVVAFGLGLYVMLAPVCSPIAILVLVITLFFGSPAVFGVITLGPKYCRFRSNLPSTLKTVGASYVVIFLLIFCMALLM